MATTRKTVAKKEATKYSKEQLLEYDGFFNEKDIINTLFNDDKKYTINEAKSIIEKFKKKEVR